MNYPPAPIFPKKIGMFPVWNKVVQDLGEEWNLLVKYMSNIWNDRVVILFFYGIISFFQNL